MKEVLIIMTNNQNQNNNNQNYEVDLSSMNMEQLQYLDRLLKENYELKQLYNEQIYFSNKNKSAVEIYGNIFASVSDAAKSLGIQRPLLYYRIKKPDFPGHFVKLNQFGEIVERSKVPFGSKKKQEEDQSDDQE